jgi:hypothetical protein
VVVRVVVTMVRNARMDFWSLPHAAVLLAGIAVLFTPTESGSISLWSLGAEHAIAPTTYGNFAPQIGSPDPAWFAFSWDAVGPMPETVGSNPAVTPLLRGTWSTVGPMPETVGSNPAVTALLRGTWSTVGPRPETLSPDPAVTALLREAVSADAEEFGVRGGSVPTIRGAAPWGSQWVCGDDQLAVRLQDGGQFWIAQGVRAAPVQFPPGVLTGSFLEIANSLGNPTQGPGGDRSNLPPPGPAGAWCRPVPVPFDQSSPLASRTFWLPVIVVLVGFVVFWSSRGLRMPA